MSVQVWLAANAGQLFVEITALIYCRIINCDNTASLDNLVIYDPICGRRAGYTVHESIQRTVYNAHLIAFL